MFPSLLLVGDAAWAGVVMLPSLLGYELEVDWGQGLFDS